MARQFCQFKIARNALCGKHAAPGHLFCQRHLYLGAYGRASAFVADIAHDHPSSARVALAVTRLRAFVRDIPPGAMNAAECAFVDAFLDAVA